MSAPVTAIPPPPPSFPPVIIQSVATLLIGTLFNWLLYGVLLTQVYFYYVSFSKDRRIIQCLVYGIFFLETLQTALSGADIHYWLAAGYGNPQILGNPYISPFDTPMLGSAISLIVQGYFCYRIWVFNKSAWFLSALIGAISMIQCVAGFLAGVSGHLRGTFILDSYEKTLLYLWLVSDAVADTLIAISMVFLLMRRRNKEHRFTDTVIVRSVQLIVETNSMTAGLALLGLILHAAGPNTNLFVAPTMAIGKVYSNTLLVAFNNRYYLRETKLPRILLPSESQSRSQTTADHTRLNSDYSSRHKLSTGPINTQLEDAEGFSLDEVNNKINTAQL